MSKVTDAMDAVNEIIEDTIDSMTKTSAKELGLDPRAGYRLYVDEQYIGVRKGDDRSLQYYGGFEYVDADDRTEMGDYVFYSRDAERVNDCLEAFEAGEQTA